MGDFVLDPPPPVSALGCNHNVSWVHRYLQEQMLGGPRSSRGSTIWNARSRLGGAKTCQNSYSGGFFGSRRASVGLRRAIVERLWGCHVIAPARPSIPRIILIGLRRWGPHQKTAQNSNSGRFFHRRGPRSMLRKEPHSRRSLATERLREGGGRGAKSSKTRVLAPFWQKAFI